MAVRSSYRLGDAHPPPPSTSPTRLLAGHLLRGGARVAWRVAAPPTALACALAGFLGPGFVESVGRVLFPPAAGVGAGTVVVLLLLGSLARALQARLRAGDSHLRTLPIAAATIERGRLLAAGIGLVPLALALAALFLASGGGREDAAPVLVDAPARGAVPTLVGLGLAIPGAALAATPGRRPRWLGLAAVILGGAGALSSLRGDLRGCIGGLLLVTAALALPARTPPLVQSRRARSRAAAPAPSRLFPLPWVRNWRALGLRRWAAAFFSAALCLAGAAAFLRNNELPDAVAAGAARLGASAATVAVLAALARTLQIRRPPWGWSRSLPRSARQRVATDAGFLAATAVVPLLVLAPAAPLAAVLAATLLPYLSLRAASVAGDREERWAGAAALAFALEGGLLAGASALAWWTAPATLLLVGPAWHGAAVRDGSARPARVSELHASDGIPGDG